VALKKASFYCNNTMVSEDIGFWILITFIVRLPMSTQSCHQKCFRMAWKRLQGRMHEKTHCVHQIFGGQTHLSTKICLLNTILAEFVAKGYQIVSTRLQNRSEKNGFLQIVLVGWF
jgi:hypothetical protein